MEVQKSDSSIRSLQHNTIGSKKHTPSTFQRRFSASNNLQTEQNLISETRQSRKMSLGKNSNRQQENLSKRFKTSFMQKYFVQNNSLSSRQSKPHKSHSKKRSKSKSKKKQPKTMIDLDNSEGLVCKLCLKELPILFFKNEDIIKRMPEQSLTPFLREMKIDLFQRAPYLKYLKVSSKFIRPCGCKSPVHSYCITAQVIRNGCVSCPKCKDQYKLFVKEEQICSPHLLGMGGAYFSFIIVGVVLVMALLMIDGKLKHAYLEENPDESLDISSRNIFLGIDVLPDYQDNIQNGGYNVLKDTRWGALLPFSVIILILMTWLISYSFNSEAQSRRKIVYAEVKQREEDISRTQSKINLKMLVEQNKRKKSDCALFDKHYYLQRTRQHQKNKSFEGFIFDVQGKIENSLNFKGIKEIKGEPKPDAKIQINELKPIAEDSRDEEEQKPLIIKNQQVVASLENQNRQTSIVSFSPNHRNQNQPQVQNNLIMKKQSFKADEDSPTSALVQQVDNTANFKNEALKVMDQSPQRNFSSGDSSFEYSPASRNKKKEQTGMNRMMSDPFIQIEREPVFVKNPEKKNTHDIILQKRYSNESFNKNQVKIRRESSSADLASETSNSLKRKEESKKSSSISFHDNTSKKSKKESDRQEEQKVEIRQIQALQTQKDLDPVERKVSQDLINLHQLIKTSNPKSGDQADDQKPTPMPIIELENSNITATEKPPDFDNISEINQTNTSLLYGNKLRENHKKFSQQTSEKHIAPLRHVTAEGSQNVLQLIKEDSQSSHNSQKESKPKEFIAFEALQRQSNEKQKEDKEDKESLLIPSYQKDKTILPTKKLSHKELIEIVNQSEEQFLNRSNSLKHVKNLRQKSPKKSIFGPKSPIFGEEKQIVQQNEMTIVDIQKTTQDQDQLIEQQTPSKSNVETRVELKSKEDENSFELEFKKSATLDYHQMVKLSPYMLQPPKLRDQKR